MTTLDVTILNRTQKRNGDGFEYSDTQDTWNQSEPQFHIGSKSKRFDAFAEKGNKERGQPRTTRATGGANTYRRTGSTCSSSKEGMQRGVICRASEVTRMQRFARYFLNYST